MNAEIQPAIDVRGLTKHYGPRTVVDRVDLRIMPGRICGFLGPQRLRQDHHSPHDLRATDARWRAGHLPRL